MIEARLADELFSAHSLQHGDIEAARRLQTRPTRASPRLAAIRAFPIGHMIIMKTRQDSRLLPPPVHSVVVDRPRIGWGPIYNMPTADYAASPHYRSHFRPRYFHRPAPVPARTTLTDRHIIDTHNR